MPHNAEICGQEICGHNSPDGLGIVPSVPEKGPSRRAKETVIRAVAIEGACGTTLAVPKNSRPHNERRSTLT
jgi:hypothetical protein